MTEKTKINFQPYWAESSNNNVSVSLWHLTHAARPKPTSASAPVIIPFLKIIFPQRRGGPTAPSFTNDDYSLEKSPSLSSRRCHAHPAAQTKTTLDIKVNNPCMDTKRDKYHQRVTVTKLESERGADLCEISKEGHFEISSLPRSTLLSPPPSFHPSFRGRFNASIRDIYGGPTIYAGEGRAERRRGKR